MLIEMFVKNMCGVVRKITRVAPTKLLTMPLHSCELNLVHLVQEK